MTEEPPFTGVRSADTVRAIACPVGSTGKTSTGNPRVQANPTMNIRSGGIKK
jgi:hypothetical protein